MPNSSRLIWPDLLRSLSLLAMASFHFGYDLEALGFNPPLPLWWPDYARVIAATFLILVGVSLWLAHGRGRRWRGFWTREAAIVAGAIAVTVVTYIAMPGFYVYFGILHSIAVCSLLAMACLRLPAIVTILLGLLALAMPYLFAMPQMNAPWLWWIGLSTRWGAAMDFVPVFPWLGWVLVGLGSAKLADATGVLRRDLPHTGALQRMTFIGRHSLAFYLIHQPVIYGSLALIAWMR
ncbi:heparan-alpha-glucosaminide N-acetyltransferase [Thioclava sp. GXIMD2076]|uniref:heparan-alpha-glucosaminide N-acetyltransferase n=1 Tax=Thioclava sp. GXIMD2076 TaxID=3131931 RepID=UPI0030CF48CA